MKKEYDLYLDWDSGTSAKAFTKIDKESLFRLNPHWIINSFESSEDSYIARITDHETERDSVLQGNITFNHTGLPCLAAQDTIWERITFGAKGGHLHAYVDYTEEPSAEEERRIVLWLRSIKEYVRLYTKTTLNTWVFRYIMNRIVLKMTPSQRKISLMLIRVTVLEMVAILLILVGWFFLFR